MLPEQARRRVEAKPISPSPAVEKAAISGRRDVLRGLGVEALALLLLLWLYRGGRLLADGRHSLARSHAEQAWPLEQSLSLSSELWLQERLLQRPWLVQTANGYYAGVHFPLTAAVLVWLYLRRREVYRRARSALVAVTAVGLLIAFAYPLAPCTSDGRSCWPLRSAGRWGLPRLRLTLVDRGGQAA